MDISDQIRAIASGDRAEFTQLYRDQHKAMLAYATGLLAGDVHAAEDAIDDAFLDIWKCASSYSGAGNAAGWVRRIVRNKAIDWLRKQKGKVLPFETCGADMTIDYSVNPEEWAAAQNDAALLKKGLAKLSLDHREAIILCYFEDLSLAEISQIVGCPQNTVKTRLFHARKQLGSQLKLMEQEVRIPSL